MSAEFTVQLPTALAQLEAYYAANWAVTDWYIDGTTGNDSNNGTTAATPLKTGAELQRRLGSYARWSHSVTIHVLANGMIDPLVVRGVTLLPNVHLDIIGTPTTVASDVLSSYSAADHTIPRATEVKGTAIADFTPYVGKRLRISGGTRAGYLTWIAKANPDGVAGAARVSPTTGPDYTSVNGSYRFVPAFVAGDPFVIESLPQVPSISIELDGVVSDISTNPTYTQRQFWLESVDCRNISIRTSGANFASKQVIFGCVVAGVICDTLLREYQTVPVVGCLWQPNLLNSNLYPRPSLLLSLVLGVSQLLDYAMSTYINQTLIQNARVVFGLNGSFSSSQVFDYVNASQPAFQIITGATVSVGNVSGSGNSFGIAIPNGSGLRTAGTVNIKGTIADCLLASTPSIQLTQAQCFQPSDYAQKGTATLVAGAVTVTVPWYENTIQKVTVTRNVPGGTIGDLSVAQVSNSQFTITSSSALDTSTVNWSISPLGREISVYPA